MFVCTLYYTSPFWLVSNPRLPHPICLVDIPSKLLGLDFQGLDPVNKRDGEITDAWNLADPDRILN